MTDLEYIESQKKYLLHFCNTHRHIYIYGAGNFGKGYFDILKTFEIDIMGFVVSNVYDNSFCGKPVVSVEQLRKKVSKQDAIIPAFRNSNVKELEIQFENSVDVLDFNHEIMLCLNDILRFFPLLDKLEKAFPLIGQQLPIRDSKNILVIRLDMIGDAIFTTPFVRELRRNFPHSNISIVVRKQNQLIWEHCPYINQVYLYDGKLREGELAEQSNNFEEVRQCVQKFVSQNWYDKEFDVAFFPRKILCGRNAIDELLLGYYSRAKYRVARTMGNELEDRVLYQRLLNDFSHVSMSNTPKHEVCYSLDMLRECGCSIKNEKMELWTDSVCESYVESVWKENNLSKYSYVIAIGIVASVETRTWSRDNYCRLLDLVYNEYQEKIVFLVLGGDDAVKDGLYLKENAKYCVDLTGKLKLDETAAIMKKCNLYVGSNTGLLHFASAFGKPSVTIYSELDDGLPTDGDSPFRMGAWEVPHIDLIPPAGLDGCHGVCRMGKAHCINLITPEQVYGAIHKLLSL